MSKKKKKKTTSQQRSGGVAQGVRPVRINNPPVPKTDIQETENLDKAISLDQKGASMFSLQLSNVQAHNG
jgi:hypothetical protein